MHIRRLRLPDDPTTDTTYVLAGTEEECRAKVFAAY